MNHIIIPSKVCIYCEGKTISRGKGEHIIPEALGCIDALKNVCWKCNNKLSLPIQEFVEKSPLHLVSAEEFGNSKDTVWSYNPAINTVAEERKSDFEPWPQLIFTRPKPIFLVSSTETKNVNLKDYYYKFYYCLKAARETLDSGKRSKIFWEEIPFEPFKGKLFPRVYSKNTFRTLRRGSTFFCKYKKGYDKDKIIWAIDRWLLKPEKLQWETSLPTPIVYGSEKYDEELILRALVNMGLNCLAFCCEQTPINKYTFFHAISYALYGKGQPVNNIESGFINNEDVQKLKCPDKTHLISIFYADRWFIDFSFFGGRIGARVILNGPNDEKWRTASITIPIGQKARIDKLKIIVPQKMRIVWSDLRNIIPSVEFSKIIGKVQRYRE